MLQDVEHLALTYVIFDVLRRIPQYDDVELKAYLTEPTYYLHHAKLTPTPLDPWNIKHSNGNQPPRYSMTRTSNVRMVDQRITTEPKQAKPALHIEVCVNESEADAESVRA